MVKIPLSKKKKDINIYKYILKRKKGTIQNFNKDMNAIKKRVIFSC